MEMEMVMANSKVGLQANYNREHLGELCRVSQELGMAVSISNNGSMIPFDWMKKYGKFVDVLGKMLIDWFYMKFHNHNHHPHPTHHCHRCECR